MENLHLSVIPAPAYCLQGQAPAGNPWLQVLRDPCLRRDGSEEPFTDTLEHGNPLASLSVAQRFGVFTRRQERFHPLR